MYTSSPRTFSSILTNVSPSGNELIVHWASSRPMEATMFLASGKLDVPEKIFTDISQRVEKQKPPRRPFARELEL
jgi:hypothetical protein